MNRGKARCPESGPAGFGGRLPGKGPSGTSPGGPPYSGCGGRKPSLTLADRSYECDHCGLVLDRDLNAAVNLARLGERLRTGATGTGTGSSPAASHRAGDGRGATRETATTKVVNAAGRETSTRHDDTVGKTGTAPSQGEAA